VRRLAAALLALAVLAPAGEAPAARKKPREIVCFKTTVVKKGKKVRRKVCRPRRAVKAKPKAAPVVAPPPLAGPTAPLSTPAPAAPQAPAAAAPAPFVCESASMWLGATAEDPTGTGARLTLSRQCVRAGRVLVQLRNTDSQDHNLWAESPAGVRTEVVGDLAGLGPAADGAVDVTPGAWRFYCDIWGHESMTRTLTVTPAG